MREVENVEVESGHLVRIGKRLYGRCGRCGRLVRIGRLKGGIHVCIR